MSSEQPDLREQLMDALSQAEVRDAAMLLQHDEGTDLLGILRFAYAMCAASGDEDTALRLKDEIEGFQDAARPVPEDRRVLGFASPFRVRALDAGFMDPEEIFLANREKFSQVPLTIGQPIEELATALSQIRQGGVLALTVPASEVTGASADTDEDTQVFIYILPREIQKIVDRTRAMALSALVGRLVAAAASDLANEDPPPEDAED